MKETVIKYKDFLLVLESNKTTETDIREFLKEEFENSINNIFLKASSEFGVDKNDISEKEKEKITSIKKELVEVYSKIVIDNISNFDKTWECEDEKIIEGDTVIDKKTKEKYFVSRFGESNNFYDENKKKYISLDDVVKK